MFHNGLFACSMGITVIAAHFTWSTEACVTDVLLQAVHLM